jgi:lipopolysaccharide transport system permease protein
VKRIQPSTGWRSLDLRQLLAYHELLFFLMWRDIMIRYRQTAVGVTWVLLQPLLTMTVFSIFFGKLGQMPSNGLPYPLFVLTGLLPWQLFAFALNHASNSLVLEQRLITKIYFPRLIVPLASVMAGLVDFCVTFLLVLAAILWYGIRPGWPLLVVPFLVLFLLAAALGVGILLATLNVQYRDVRFTIPFLTQFWMFLTPVAYPSSMVPSSYRVLYGLNPMTGVIEAFRWALLGTAPPDWRMMVVSAVVVAGLLTVALYYFKRMEQTFADVI